MKHLALLPLLVGALGLMPQVAAAGELVSIRTPSDNIHCMFSDDPVGSVECEIVDLSPSSGLPDKPADCDLDFGHRFFVREAGVADMTCYGDTLRNGDARVLAYDDSVSYYGVTCSSSQKGLTCQNERGHGFFLSRAKQELF